MYRILFQNENMIAVEKPQGLVCEPDEKDEDCLIAEVRRDVDANAALCHRLDRNTGGIVLIARNEEALNVLEKAIGEKRIRKIYAAVVAGNAFQRFGGGKRTVSLRGYHFKDARLGRVYIYDQPRKLARPVETKVRSVSFNEEEGTTLVEAELVTGRTHQIRAQLAHAGHPVAGDGKYGRNAENKKLRYRYQALWAKEVIFDPDTSKKMGLPDKIKSKPYFT